MGSVAAGEEGHVVAAKASIAFFHCTAVIVAKVFHCYSYLL
jgi:hypothetical protein